MIIGLVGAHLGHSYSKEVHELLRKCKYDLMEIKEEEFDQFIKTKEYDGLNITIPYKQRVIPFLDFVSENAKRIGAVNTIVNKNGNLYGYNTDYYGIEYTFSKYNIVIKNKTCVILGTGGTSKTLKTILEDLGAKKIYFVSRIKVENNDNIIDYNDLKEIQDVNLIINSTPVGMYPNFKSSLVDLSVHKNLDAVFDVIFNPLRSGLILEAEKLGIRAYSGMSMLVGQAIVSNELFYNDKLDIGLRDRITDELINKVRNIVFIGMPASGKSSIANYLAKDLRKKVVDIDSEIERKTGMKIKEIFENYGEEYFRNIEHNIISSASLLKSVIISTGGGAVLDPENILNLKANGIVIYLTRDIEKMVIDDKRPLSKTKEDLNKLFLARKDLYMNAADLVIENNDEIKNTIEKIKEKLQ